jgi:hypothetical protein
LPRSGFHNPVVPLLLGADYVENIASSIVEYWAVFTELLSGKALIKSVTIQSFKPHTDPGVDSASNRNEYQESSGE